MENSSQPTLDNLYEALGKAYGIPATRVWAIKHNWSKHEWVRLTREMGFKKVSKVCGMIRMYASKASFLSLSSTSVVQ